MKLGSGMATAAALVLSAALTSCGGGRDDLREDSMAAKWCPAGPTVYESRDAFLASTKQPIIDDYSSYAAGTYTDAAMSAVFGETRYEPISFPGLNIIGPSDSNPDPANQSYCAGCNGNFKLHFDETSRSVPKRGVPSVAVDVVVHTSRHTSFGDPDPNEVSLPGTVVVEFGNGETTQITVPPDVGYFGPQAFFIGLSDERLIKSMTFGTEPLASRHFWGIDNLTIARKPNGPCF